MMSLRALGNLGSGGGAARLAANYYQEHSADYYMDDVDHQGQWMGSGAQELGLEDAVDRSEFQLGLAGYVAGEQVQNAGKENRQMGWDLTYSAPKSVSIVWAGADPSHRQEIEEAHRKAVECAFDYLEANTVTRRGKGGYIHESTGLVAARFNHYTSRAGDPQLHSHVVVSNFSVRNTDCRGHFARKRGRPPGHGADSAQAELQRHHLVAGVLLSNRVMASGHQAHRGHQALGGFRARGIKPIPVSEGEDDAFQGKDALDQAGQIVEELFSVLKQHHLLGQLV